MAHCANCGKEIPSTDKTRLCDDCKKIILPFVKFTDVSTSSAVRRLVANEKNLRSAGVTDSGMEYLLRICEINDKRRQAEREAKQAANAAQNPSVNREPPVQQGMEEIEIPYDEPLNLHREAYGSYLPATKVILIAVGAVEVVWFVAKIVLEQGVDATPMISAVGSFAAAYGISVVQKMKDDLEEIKRRFR